MIGGLVLVGGVYTGVVAVRDAGGGALRAVNRALSEPAAAGTQPRRDDDTTGGYWPARKGFSYLPCEQEGEICGSSQGPVFNSFIASPSAGDERVFFDGRRSDRTARGSYANVVTDVTEGSSELVLRIYVNNNADPETNATGVGIARNARVRVGLPTVTGSALQAVAWIEADNARPPAVQDTVQLTATESFRVSYVPGSAVLFSNSGQLRLSDSIVGQDGALIGIEQPDGRLPGGFRNEVVVQLRVRIEAT